MCYKLTGPPIACRLNPEETEFFLWHDIKHGAIQKQTYKFEKNKDLKMSQISS